MLGLAAVGFRRRWQGGGRANATGRAAIDSNAQRGHTYQYNRRGRNVTVGAQNFPTCAAKHPTQHTQTAHFQHQRSAFFKITKNIKSHFLLSSFCSAVRCRVPQSVAYRGWCTHRQADRPLPHLAAAAPALPVATRKTTRLSRQSPLLFLQNAQLFVPSPHAGDTTRALASRTQRVRNSCLHPSPSHLPD